jgi:tetratricopeptide (TPR) repeat protein/DNA/RNA endonuclease YhcR with UshA esterase domain
MTLGEMLAPAEGADYLRRGLEIRQKLAAQDPSSVIYQKDLAGALSTLARAATNLSVKEDYFSQELRIREHLEEAGRGAPGQWERAAELAAAYEAQSASEPTSPEQAVGWLKKAVSLRTHIATNLVANARTAPDAETNPSINDNLPAMAADLQKLTALSSHAGKYDEAVPLAESWIQTVKALPLDGQSQKEVLLADAYRARAGAQEKLGRAREALADLEDASKILQRYIVVQRDSSYWKREQWDELDATWQNMIGLYLDQSNLTQAIGIARAARDYWSGQVSGYSDDTFYSSRLAVSWLRLADVYQLAGQGSDATNATAQAARIEQSLIKDEPSLMVDMLEILSQRAVEPKRQNEGLKDRFRGACLQEAMAALETIVLKTDLAMPPEFLSWPQIHILETQKNFSSLLASWKARSPSLDQPADSKPAVLEVTRENVPAILAAAHNKRSLSLKGVVRATSRSPTRRTTYILYAQVPQDDFVAVIRSVNENPVVQKIGGLIEEALPGATLTITGVPELWNHEQLEIRIETPEQIVAVEHLAAGFSSTNVISKEGGTTLDSPTNPVLDATNISDLSPQMGKEVVVKGSIRQAAWNGSGTVLNIEFQNTSAHGLMAVIFKRDVAGIIDSLKGDLDLMLPGKTVRIRGTLKLYRQRPELIISQPGQLTILDSPARPSLH